MKKGGRPGPHPNPNHEWNKNPDKFDFRNRNQSVDCEAYWNYYNNSINFIIINSYRKLIDIFHHSKLKL